MVILVAGDVVVVLEWAEAGRILRALRHPRENGAKETLENLRVTIGEARMNLANTIARKAMAEMDLLDHDHKPVYNGVFKHCPTCGGN